MGQKNITELLLYTYLKIINFYILFFLAINCIGQPLSPLDLHFEKDYQVRNFYNSQVILSQLNFSKEPMEISSLKLMHMTTPGCAFKRSGKVLIISNNTLEKQESYFNLGKIYNYSAIDFDLFNQKSQLSKASGVLSIFKNKDNQFIISQNCLASDKKEIVFQIIKNGRIVYKNTILNKAFNSPNSIRIHLTGKFLNILFLKNNDWTVLGSFDVGKYFELRDKNILSAFNLFVGAKLGHSESITISKVQQYLTSGTAQADPKILHYEDGNPIVENNKIWVAMTTRGYGTQLYQGIYAYDLITKKWEISGTLVFNKGDGLIRQWAASDVFYDRKSNTWCVITVSHRDDHMLYLGKVNKDLRYGMTEIPVSKLKYQSVNNEEDPSVIWDNKAGKWRMAICKAKNGYQTILMEADHLDGEWKQLSIYEPTSSTGALIQKIGGKRYVFIGRGNTPCPLEILSYPAMKKLGELNLSEHPKGKNIWPAILPIIEKNGTSYFLLTFDRDAWTGPRTYGNLHWYKAKEFASNYFEYGSK